MFNQLSRFVLALVAFALLWIPFAVFLQPSGPFTIIPALSVLAVLVAVPLAVVFVWCSWSVERLYASLLAVTVLTLIFGFLGLVFHSLYLTFANPGPRAPANPGFATTGPSPLELASVFGSILAVYVLAFLFIYRGGYDRLKARLA